MFFRSYPLESLRQLTNVCGIRLETDGYIGLSWWILCLLIIRRCQAINRDDIDIVSPDFFQSAQQQLKSRRWEVLHYRWCTNGHIIWQYAGIVSDMMENYLLWQWFKVHTYWASVFRTGLGPRDYFVTTEVFVRSLCMLRCFVGSIPYIGLLLTHTITSVEAKTRYTEHQHDM